MFWQLRKASRPERQARAAAALQAWAKSLRIDLGRAGIPWSPARFATAAAGAAAGMAAIAFAVGGAGWAAAAAALVLAASFLRLKLRAVRRMRAFDAQIATALSLIAASLRAGDTLAQALEVVAREMPPPARDEFGKASASIAAGASAEAALKAMLDRLHSDDLERVVTAVVLERYLGGDLAEALERIAFTVRERRWGRRRMRAATAQG